MNEETGVRVGATPEPLTDGDRLLKFLCDLHEHLPDEQRPMSWSDFSDGQIARARKAWAALRAPEPLTAALRSIQHIAENDLRGWSDWDRVASMCRAALEGGVSPQPSSSVHQTENAGEAVQRPAGEQRSARTEFEAFYPDAHKHWNSRTAAFGGSYADLWTGWLDRGESDARRRERP